MGPEGRSVFEEGLFIPSIKCFDQGVANETFFDFIRAGSRLPVELEGNSPTSFLITPAAPPSPRSRNSRAQALREITTRNSIAGRAVANERTVMVCFPSCPLISSL
jgi:hypothetical protein